MREGLPIYLRALRDGASHRDAVLSVAHALSHDPWRVVAVAGLLARCRVETATRDGSLTEQLAMRVVSSKLGLVKVARGAPYPVLQHAGRKNRGAFDTPREMARELVRQALTVSPQARSGLDTACGTGTFLLALAEAGLGHVSGSDIDPLALEVAGVAVPSAELSLGDALDPGPMADLVVGNPPYVPPERQPDALRARARERFPWLRGRFDLVVPVAAAAAERAQMVAAFVLPASVLVQRYGAPLRRRWLQSHRLAHLTGPERFPGATVDVVQLVLEMGKGPGPTAPHGVPAQALLALDAVPIDPALHASDLLLAQRVRAHSVPLGSLCLVDTGVVSHRPGGSREALLFEEPGPGRVPYADARDFFRGRRRWLRYAPEEMHRAKKPSMFEAPKLVVQRIRGRGPVRAAIDRTGVYLGHTCTVVQPHAEAIDLDLCLDLVTASALHGVLRVERGRGLDLYPRDVAAIPVPRAWLQGPRTPLAQALGLEPSEMRRLAELGG